MKMSKQENRLHGASGELYGDMFGIVCDRKMPEKLKM